jgi:hypothetical protein
MYGILSVNIAAAAGAVGEWCNMQTASANHCT